MLQKVAVARKSLQMDDGSMRRQKVSVVSFALLQKLTVKEGHEEPECESSCGSKTRRGLAA